MNKTDAFNRLTSLEKEAGELRKILEATERPVDIKERVKTFEDACEITGHNSLADKFTIGDKDDIAFQKLKVIAKALNEGWVPVLSNTIEYKYYPWYKVSGSGLTCHVYGYWHSVTDVGVRLCFKTADLATYAGKQFLSLYNDYLT